MLASLPESIGNLKSLKTLNLSYIQLTALPESIGNLKSLQRLNLSNNKLSTLPESIMKLELLLELYLSRNKLTTLPEPIGNLQLLKTLNLSYNQLTALPVPIGNLKSLQTLNLRSNKLATLPGSMWQLKNLGSFNLTENPWEGELKEIVKRDIPAIREFCRQRVTINIFISHTVNEFASYRIKELAEHLGHQPEINQVYFCEEDLKGNIDAWMEETVPKSQLLLFIGTKQSRFSKDCTEELRLARVNDIPIIPIRGIDIEWKELESIGLSRELGFEFDEKKFNTFCENLYTYIYEFKRKRDLLSKETDKIEGIKSRLKSLIKDNLDSEVINKIFTDKFSEIESLEKEFKTNKITFIEFWKKLGDILG